jgi:hypothetical protein
MEEVVGSSPIVITTSLIEIKPKKNFIINIIDTCNV